MRMHTGATPLHLTSCTTQPRSTYVACSSCLPSSRELTERIAKIIGFWGLARSPIPLCCGGTRRISRMSSPWSRKLVTMLPMTENESREQLCGPPLFAPLQRKIVTIATSLKAREKILSNQSWSLAKGQRTHPHPSAAPGDMWLRKEKKTQCTSKGLRHKTWHIFEACRLSHGFHLLRGNKTDSMRYSEILLDLDRCAKFQIQAVLDCTSGRVLAGGMFTRFGFHLVDCANPARSETVSQSAQATTTGIGRHVMA